MNWLFKIFKRKKKNYGYIRKTDEEWDAFMNFAKGEKYFLNGDYKEALTFLDKAIEQNYNHNNLFGYRAICLQSLGFEFDAIEDFDKAISISPNDCNLYFTRSISKDVILDYVGEIKDIEKAIELSKIDSSINRSYNENAINIGYKNGIRDLYEIELLGAKSRLEFTINELNKNHTEDGLKLIKRR